MMRKYLKESLHWINLALFKPITLQAEARGLSSRQGVCVYSRVLPVQLAIILGFVTIAGLVFHFLGYPFKWSDALVLTILGLSFGMVFGLVGGLGIGLVFSVLLGLVGGVGIDAVGALVGRLGVGLGGGVIVGVLFGLVEGLLGGLLRGAGAWLLGGLTGLLLGGFVGFYDGVTEALRFEASYVTGFLFTYVRPFQLIPHLCQLWRSRKAVDPVHIFQESPVYWDEAIAMPLPFLSDWLVHLVGYDRKRGMSEVAYVAGLRYQRRAAQRALISILVHDLQQADSFEKMASATEKLAILPSDAQYLPTGFNDISRHIRRIAELASDYLTRVTPVGQMKVLEELRERLVSFASLATLMAVGKFTVFPAFVIPAVRWLEIVSAEEVRVRKQLAFEPIPNPFVVGNPLMVRDHNLFKGRKDIIAAIEENIINPAQRPALLLYGRRRIGKTSTLLNLPGSQFVPVFIDFQDAKWREGDDAFCFHLAASIHDALNERVMVQTASRPKLEQFERYPFTRLGEYLDHIEKSSRDTHKQILLTFDEYEKLEEGISASKVTTEVLNQLRTIVQHRERIVVLFSGGHRFEEMTTINWSDYLINVKTLELSYLAPTDARELITEPVPLLQYQSGVVEQIIEFTHRQPYLLQVVASALVNYLNSERRLLATPHDLEIAVEKVLVTADSYFFYTWREDCTEAEREVLRMTAVGDTNNLTLAEHQGSVQSLCHKEILERHASGYRFSIELFRRWVLKNQTAQPFTPGDLPETAELEYSDLVTTHT